jgi:hypothetical protein
MNKLKVRNYYHVPKTKLKSDTVRRIFCSSPSDSPENLTGKLRRKTSPENFTGKLRRKTLLEIIRDNERVVKDDSKPLENTSFYSPTSSSTSQNQICFTIKNSKIQSCCLPHERGEILHH